MRSNKKYTKEFKEAAVKLVTEQQYSKEEATKRLGTCSSNIKRWWCHEMSGNVSEKPRIPVKDEELLRLRKQIKRLEMERDILQKASAFFASESL